MYISFSSDTRSRKMCIRDSFEGISYKGLTSRISRNPARYKTRTEAREGGGKELVLLSTASLSQKGRRAYRAQIRAMAEPEEAGETAPWYVEADLGSYIAVSYTHLERG